MPALTRNNDGFPVRNRHHFWWMTVLALALTGVSCSDPPLAEHPNIILIMADDLGYSDIGPFGGEINTPNLDMLAENGVRFTQFYNAARCWPTRASLLTGLYPHQVGLGGSLAQRGSSNEPGPGQGYLGRSGITIAEALGAAGYHTYMSGKWHVGEDPEHWPRERGFDRYFGLISGASSYFEIISDQPRVRQMALNDDPWTPPDEGFYMTDAISDYAVRWIDEHDSNHDQSPFFLYVPYTAPHWPLHALPEDIATYEGVYDVGWDSLRVLRHHRLIQMGLIQANTTLSDRTPGIPEWSEVDDKDEWTRRMQVYAAMVDRMDQGIGSILDALRMRGLLEQSIVFFIADNGGSAESVVARGLNHRESVIGERTSYAAYREPWANASNTPFRLYKARAYEGGIASPFIAFVPGGPWSGEIDAHQVGHVMDLMPTILDLAGAEYPAQYEGNILDPLEGVSLAPALLHGEIVSRPPLFWEHMGRRAVRSGSWKLVAPRGGEWELYDLASDRTELVDLASTRPEIVEDLGSLWDSWADRTDVKSLRWWRQ